MKSEDEQIPTGSDQPVRPRHMSDMLRLFSPHGLDVRGENAYYAAVRFIELLFTEVKDPEWQQTLFRAWIGAVKNRNHSRFAKELRRWKRSLAEPVKTEESVKLGPLLRTDPGSSG